MLGRGLSVMQGFLPVEVGKKVLYLNSRTPVKGTGNTETGFAT